ncbi:D-glycero-alpha-D-manno-heptose-1,7-bisphosphate 7-phosphatase [Streptomyces sp. enrichment culture]|uniref:D-glycero-alpha-D-manno-heptose-1,7-bisphosphate 7-phosphatase n=1 Tax=Streptomyces sp. enrichment culture TaxID=1795815 RepID=UPI003F560C86
MSPVRAVLFDRDGTLVHDVPYNADPDRVRPVAGAREALDALRARGIRTGIVTNQSGIARRLLTETDVRRVNARVEELLGPFDVWAVCPHGPDDGCPCRKPRPGMVLDAAARLGADPAHCVVVGDIGSDVEAARRAGAHAVLVPTPVTRPEETAAAPHVARSLPAAVRLILDGPPWEAPGGAPAPGPNAGAAHERVAAGRAGRVRAGPEAEPPRTGRYL